MAEGLLHEPARVEIIKNIDERLKTEPIEFGGKTYTLSEINQLLPLSEDRVSMVIEWDNMCQYMAVGLVTVINELLKKDKIIDLNTFFTRDNDYPDGIDYVKFEFFKNTLRPDIIHKIYENYYKQIMERSPITLLFDRINLLKPMVSNITFIFKYEFEGIAEFVQDIANTKFVNTIECHYYVLKTEEEHNNFIRTLDADIYVVPDMGLYYHTLLELNRKNKTLLSYIDHNGVNEYILAMYANVYSDTSSRPINNIRLGFIEEVISEHKEEEKEYNIGG